VPERPDLDYVVPILARELRGAVIGRVNVANPVVLRVAVRGKAEELLVGRRIGGVDRRAHFVTFHADGDPPLDVVVSPMLAGRFRIDPKSAKPPRDLAFALELEDGRELRYRDDVQMGKVYVTAHGDVASVPGLAKIGVDVLDPKKFTLDAFRTIARARRDQVKVFLMDKSALDAMGNAYADEVLFEARIHPKAMARSLPPDAIARLHAAVVKVIGDACRTIAERKPALDEKLRDFLKVRGHPGEPCPRCGSTLRKAGVHGHDAIFCPICQEDARGTGIVDWSKIGGGAAPREAADTTRKEESADALQRKPSAVGEKRSRGGRTTAPKTKPAAATAKRIKRGTS
jgi:formamidopyrimidine-DNA glycosylase